MDDNDEDGAVVVKRNRDAFVSLIDLMTKDPTLVPI